MARFYAHATCRRPDPRRLLERMILADLCLVPADERRELWTWYVAVRREREVLRRCA